MSSAEYLIIISQISIFFKIIQKQAIFYLNKYRCKITIIFLQRSFTLEVAVLKDKYNQLLLKAVTYTLTLYIYLNFQLMTYCRYNRSLSHINNSNIINILRVSQLSSQVVRSSLIQQNLLRQLDQRNVRNLLRD